jgi:alkylhydroperoxidase/carboxymuconolactone decarboxylase family protein YurZ
MWAVDPPAGIGQLAFDLGLSDSDLLSRFLPQGYAEAYADLAAAATRRHALTVAERELLLMALNASVTLYDRQAVELHARRALEAGATPEQIVATKVESMGAHTMSTFLPVLVEELESAGHTLMVPSGDDLTDEEADAKSSITKLRGWWNEAWTPLLRIDPGYLLAAQTFMASSQEPLEPRLRELIYIAVDIVTTHLYEPGARAHIRNALKLGVSVDELLEVFELAALVPFKTVGIVLSALAAAHDTSP